ncbi:hypothetical protein SDC9_136531 [bioreactor metagenome]|uniref:Potassium channel domain-containing protein n=1 Tax=bioreactor metagenome TaxID=1076179 RepID=A0A645DLJ3_9ZZZZ|nr:ion channel [Paludibacter sp.]
MTQRIANFIKILLLGQEHSQPQNKLQPAIQNQWLNVKRIWNNEHYNDFGIERLIRLILALTLFIFPGLYIRAIFSKFGLLGRKLGVEFYVIIKLILPILFFKLDWTNNLIVVIIVAIMAVETVIYLAALIFLSNEFTRPISYRRSLTTLFINYIEICLDYAVIYSYCNFAIVGFFKEKLVADIQAIYFSFVTSATVGYGDILVEKPLGQYLVISQMILFLVFVGLFINFFTSKVQDPTYYNAKPTYNNKFNKHTDKIKK